MIETITKLLKEYNREFVLKMISKGKYEISFPGNESFEITDSDIKELRL